MKVAQRQHIFLLVLIACLLVTSVLPVTAATAKNADHTFQSAQDVLDFISDKQPEISPDGKSVILPASPDPQYEVSLFGSDNQQIIARDLSFYQPISDMNVNVLYKVTNKGDSKDVAVSAEDIPVKVKGKHSAKSGDNPIPNVIPGLREWKGHRGEFKLSKKSRLVVDRSAADSIVDEANLIRNYFKKMLDKDIPVAVGAKPKKGDIYLTINPSQKHLGNEGYTLDITDQIVVSAPKPQGINYGGMSITQILYQSKDKLTLPKGIARDYPKYEVRSGMLDVGRMYIPLEYVQEMAEYMAWFKLNELQMHINDFRAGANYEAFRVESKQYPEINAKDGYYPQEEYIVFQKEMKKYGIDVVTEIDTPYHAESFRAVNADMMLKRGALDITTPEKRALVYPFIESLFDEFLGTSPKDENRVVQSTKFHIGTDEYDKAYSEQMRHYTDHFINYVNGKGYETRLWGSLGKNGFDGDTPVSSEATMNIWAPYWSDVKEMYALGYDVINTAGGDLYIVPLGNAGFPDYLDIKDKYDTWEVNNFWSAYRMGGKGGATMPFAHPQTKGAEFALWNDLTAYTGGLSSYDIFDRMKDAVMLVSEKTWYGEKTAGQTADQFMKRVKAVQNKTPLSNPARFVESKTPIVLKYDFESVNKGIVKDVTSNGYDAKLKGGKIVDSRGGKTFQLDGNSYLELPVSGIGYPYSVAFDIKLDEGSRDDATLFSGKDGAFYLTVDETGKLGYERNEPTSENSKTKFENYTFRHDYALPENKWHHVLLIGDNKETALYVDGKKVSTAKQVNKLGGRANDSTSFVLPLEQIGKGVKGEIDNITLMNQALTNSLKKNVAYRQKVTASSEYDQTQKVAHITDGNFGTRWGSQYKGISEEEKDNQWVLVEFDQPYQLHEVKLHWEAARAKKYKLLVSTDGETFEEVYNHTYDPGHGLLDTIPLDANVKYLKVAMSERATQYGYSIFQLEAFGAVDFKDGEKLIDEAEELLDLVPQEAGGAKEREQLVAAKDELKTFLSEADKDLFTYDVLTGQLNDRLDDFKRSIVVPRNVARGQKVTASSEYNDAQKASHLTDGDFGTRWGSQYKGISEEEKDNQWVMVELDDRYDLDTVKIYWETARAEKYDVFLSNDGKTFEKVYTHRHDPKKGNIDVIGLQDVHAKNAKFLKVAMSKRATKYGYSIYEIEAYHFAAAKRSIREAERLLQDVPAELGGEFERAELSAALEELQTYLARQDIGFEYHLLNSQLAKKVAFFKKSIAMSADKIKASVERFEAEGEFKNHGAASALSAHITTVSRFEEKGEVAKVVKHTKKFTEMLDQQKKKELISEKAYDALREDAEWLLLKWQ